MACVEIERQILFFSFGFARVTEVRHILKRLIPTEFVPIKVKLELLQGYKLTHITFKIRTISFRVHLY